MEELKPCPFCGENGIIRRVSNSHKTNPTCILDEWRVECCQKCCYTPSFPDEIYHADSGEVVIKHNGAKEAISAWNRRINA